MDQTKSASEQALRDLLNDVAEIANGMNQFMDALRTCVIGPQLGRPLYTHFHPAWERLQQAVPVAHQLLEMLGPAPAASKKQKAAKEG